MLFAGHTFSADALRGLRRPSHKTQYDSETVTLSKQDTPLQLSLLLWLFLFIKLLLTAILRISLIHAAYVVIKVNFLSN